LFSLFKKKASVERFPFQELGTDMHSHLIPAVDDGSPGVVQSIELIKGMLELGYTKLITSPHIMQDMYPNSPQTIGMGYDEILRSWKPGKPPLNYAAEYFLDDHVFDLLGRSEKLLTLTGNKVLVELSFISPPIGLKDMIFELQMKGYEPILAHPERYTYCHRNPSVYAELQGTGCFLQCNLLSFSGYYGESVKEAAEYLVAKGLVDLLGTDLHHSRHLKALQELPYTPALRKLMEKSLLNREL
jgi:tyrosine-protein phosphatase YwqE